jgi:hypothetical protein
VQCLIWNFSINCGPLGYDAVQSCRLLRLFQGNISLHVQSFSNHVQGHSSFTTFPQWQAQISNEFQVMHVTFQVLIAASMKVTTFGNVAPCSLVEVYRRFRCPNCHHYQGGDTVSIISAMSHRRDDGGSTHLWNVGLLPRDYTVLNPRKLSLPITNIWRFEISSVCWDSKFRTRRNSGKRIICWISHWHVDRHRRPKLALMLHSIKVYCGMEVNIHTILNVLIGIMVTRLTSVL